MEVPVVLGRVVLGLVAQEQALARAERLRVLGGRVGHLLAVRLVAALRLRRAPAAKTTAGLRCRARDSWAASRPGPHACHLIFLALID